MRKDNGNDLMGRFNANDNIYFATNKMQVLDSYFATHFKVGGNESTNLLMHLYFQSLLLVRLQIPLLQITRIEKICWTAANYIFQIILLDMHFLFFIY